MSDTTGNAAQRAELEEMMRLANKLTATEVVIQTNIAQPLLHAVIGAHNQEQGAQRLAKRLARRIANAEGGS